MREGTCRTTIYTVGNTWKSIGYFRYKYRSSIEPGTAKVSVFLEPSMWRLEKRPSEDEIMARLISCAKLSESYVTASFHLLL